MADKRPNAMLTQTQRDFLKGEKEYTGSSAKQQRYERRRAIKDRIHHTLLDFQLLFETWDERGTGELFGEDPATGDVSKGISALLGLLYSETYEHGRFENLLNRGVQRGEERITPDDDSLIRVNFDVDRVSRVDMEEALAKYRKRGSVSDMAPYELAAVAEILRRESSIEGGGLDAAQAASEAWEKRVSDIEDGLGDTEG